MAAASLDDEGSQAAGASSPEGALAVRASVFEQADKEGEEAARSVATPCCPAGESEAFDDVAPVEGAASVSAPSDEDASYQQLPPEVALAASALCEATADDAKACELLRRYWGLDEQTATRAVREARGRLLVMDKDKQLGLLDFLKRGEYSFESIENYMESYVEENADVIRTGVKGGGIKFVVSSILKALYTVFNKYIIAFIEPLLAMLTKIFPFFPFV